MVDRTRSRQRKCSSCHAGYRMSFEVGALTVCIPGICGGIAMLGGVEINAFSFLIGRLSKPAIFDDNQPHQSPLSNTKQKRMQHSEMEPTPSKRPRPLAKESLAALNGGEDDSMQSSQDAGGGDECPPRTLFTREERVAGSVEKYSDMFSELLDQLHHRQQMEAFQRDGVDLFTGSDVNTLLQSLKVMRKSDLIRKVDPDLLIMLMGSLDKQV